MIDKITWECHVCGEVRPDDKISVFTRDVSQKYDLPKETLKENIRYCNDKQDCVEGSRKTKLI